MVWLPFHGVVAVPNARETAAVRTGALVAAATIPMSIAKSMDIKAFPNSVAMRASMRWPIAWAKSGARKPLAHSAMRA
jgi:hypothetical protein